ncbi:MAG: metallophosphoesterase family protein [Pseudomonadota bacterium]
MRIYAIGDIHGHVEKLDAAHQAILQDRERNGDWTAPVVHLGDLVDRGPDSKSVIEYLMAGIAEGAPWIVLKGNHDRMFVDFIECDDEEPRLFRGMSYLHDTLGGRTTLESYGVTGGLLSRERTLQSKAVEAVPQSHIDFLDARPLFFRFGEILFVHAGIRPGVPLEDQVEEDLLWIRGPFLDDPGDHGALIVHGHTPVDEIEHWGNRVALDTGAAFGGPLVPAVFEDGELFALTEYGRSPIRAGSARPG